MVFGQKRLKTLFFHFVSNHSKNVPKHHFKARFTYTETFRKFEILTKFPRGLFMLFLFPITLKTPKTVKNPLCLHFVSNHSKNLPKHHFSARFTYTENFRKFKILTQFPRVCSWFLAKKRLKTLCLQFVSNHSKNLPKHHFSARFTYTENFRKFKILTQFPRGLFMVFGQKTVKNTLLAVCFQSL